MSKSEKRRYTVVLPERTADRLENLKSMTDATSVTDVVKDALLTYETIVNLLSEGVEFQAIRPDGKAMEVLFQIDVPAYEKAA